MPAQRTQHKVLQAEGDNGGSQVSHKQSRGVSVGGRQNDGDFKEVTTPGKVGLQQYALCNVIMSCHDDCGGDELMLWMEFGGRKL